MKERSFLVIMGIIVLIFIALFVGCMIKHNHLINEINLKEEQLKRYMELDDGWTIEREELNKKINSLEEQLKKYKTSKVSGTLLEPTGEKTILSEREYEILAKLLYCEARGSSFEGQVYTCSAILNLSDYRKNSIWNMAHDVNTFSPAPFVDSVKPNQMQYDVIDYVLDGGRVPEICYFRMNHYHNFGTPVCKVDGHYFSKP